MSDYSESDNRLVLRSYEKLKNFDTDKGSLQTMKSKSFLMTEKLIIEEQNEIINALRKELAESKWLKELFRETEERYRILINLSPNAICFLQEGRFTFINDAFTQTFGYSQEELDSTQSYLDIVHEDYREVVDRFYRMRTSGKRIPGTFYVRMVCKDGHAKPCETFINLVQYNGRPADMVLYHDLSTRLKAENELKEAYAELEKNVHSRTVELLEANQLLKYEIEKRKQLEQKLIDNNRKLEDVNAALRVLLKKRDEDKLDIEKRMNLNIHQMVYPALEKLKKSGLTKKQESFIDILDANLSNITSSFSVKLASKRVKLTPSEIQIANLVRQGKTTKEISSILNLSERTIEYHRNNIRKKLGLQKMKENLTTYLLSLE